MTDSDDKEPKKEVDPIAKILKGVTGSSSINELNEKFKKDLSTDVFKLQDFEPKPLNIPDPSEYLPKYFPLTTEELKSLSNDDLYNLLQDDFLALEDTAVKQKILMKYPDHQLHKDSKDAAKEILADRRSEPKPQSFWQRIGWYWNSLISAIIGALIAKFIS